LDETELAELEEREWAEEEEEHEEEQDEEQEQEQEEDEEDEEDEENEEEGDGGGDGGGGGDADEIEDPSGDEAWLDRAAVWDGGGGGAQVRASPPDAVPPPLPPPPSAFAKRFPHFTSLATLRAAGESMCVDYWNQFTDASAGAQATGAHGMAGWSDGFAPGGRQPKLAKGKRGSSKKPVRNSWRTKHGGGRVFYTANGQQLTGAAAMQAYRNQGHRAPRNAAGGTGASRRRSRTVPARTVPARNNE